MNIKTQILIIILTALSPLTYAQLSPLKSELGKSYYYVDHYDITIDTPVEQVWPHVIDLGSWIYDFEMAHISGPVQGQGEVLQLYKDQDFYIEIVKIIPNQMLLAVNLPTTQEGEDVHGTVMVSLAGNGQQTIVSVFMSRIFTWFEAGPNRLREQRESDEFLQQRQIYFEERFLPRLKELAEN